MSGGIDYRLSPKELQLFGESVDIFRSVETRLEKYGVKLQLTDPEMKVSVEESDQGTRFTLVYPFDNDQEPFTGRVYLQDEFILSKDLDIVQYHRSFRQDLLQNQKIRFWVDLARADHPDDLYPSKQEHLEKFLSDLSGLPGPAPGGPELQNFHQKVLKQLHRPFPPNFQQVVNQNLGVFKELASALKGHGVKMKFGDPQSGIRLEREGKKIILEITVVIDNERGRGARAEQNGRIYLLDHYEIDSENLQLLSFERSFQGSSLEPSLYEALKIAQGTSAPPLDLPELTAFAGSVLQGLEPGKKKPPQAASTTDYPKLFLAAKTDFEKLLVSLYEFTDLEAKTEFTPDGGLAGRSGLPEDRVARKALHEAIGQLLLQPKEAAAEIRKLGIDWNVAPETQALLDCLAELAEGRPEEAGRALHRLPRNSHFRRRFEILIKAYGSRTTAAELLPVLRAAATEALEGKLSHDRAWLQFASGDPETRDPALRRAALEAYFQRLSHYLGEHDVSLAEAVRNTAPQNGFEQALLNDWEQDRVAQGVLSLSEEPNASIRGKGLLNLAHGHLMRAGQSNLTALAVLQAVGPESEAARPLKNWLSGEAGFALKLEMLLPHFAAEATSPTMVVAMGVAGSLAGFGKFAFLGRWGYHSRALRWGSEAAALSLEAPAFLLVEKGLRSSFISPDRQWDQFGSDLEGAYLAFGALRLAGVGSRKIGEALDRRFLTAEGLPTHSFYPYWRGLATHGLNLGSLMAANGLARALNRREASPQGLAGDLVDDMLMYGQFLIGANLAQRIRPGLGLNDWELYLTAMEKAPLGAGKPVAEPTPKQSQGRAVAIREWLGRLRMGPKKSDGNPEGRWALTQRFVDWVDWAIHGFRDPSQPNQGAPPAPPTTATSSAGESSGEKISAPATSSPGTLPPAPPSRKPSKPPRFRTPVPFTAPEAFIHKQNLHLRMDENQVGEWVLGSDSPNFAFPAQSPGIHPRHARIRMETLKGKAETVDYAYSLEPLEGVTLINGRKMQDGIHRLHNGDAIILGEGGVGLTFKIEKESRLGYLVEDPIPLSPGKTEWIIGRESAANPPPDIAFPNSERAVSRRHLKIVRDPQANYFLQDLSAEGTAVNSSRVYAPWQLKHEDRIDLGRELQLGNARKIWFHQPKKKSRSKITIIPPSHEWAGHAPQQAEVHPAYRGMTQEQAAKHVEDVRLMESTTRDMEGGDWASKVQVARFVLKDKMEIVLEADKTGFILGTELNTALPPHRISVPFLPTKGLEARHGFFYLDAQGRFILQDLSSEAGIFVQPRTYRDITRKVTEIIDGKEYVQLVTSRIWEEVPTSAQQKIEGWTQLHGGERVFLGKDLFFDFKPGVVAPLPPNLSPVHGPPPQASPLHPPKNPRKE